MRIPVSKCPLREGGGPKGRGWIRLAEARPAKQVISHMAHTEDAIHQMRILGIVSLIIQSGQHTPLASLASPRWEATHYDLSVAGAPPNHVRCHLKGTRSLAAKPQSGLIRRRYIISAPPPSFLIHRVDGIRFLCPPLTEPYVRFSRIRLFK